MNNISLRKTALVLIFLTSIHNFTAYCTQIDINQTKLSDSLSKNSQKEEDNKKESNESSNAEKILVGIFVIPAILFLMCMYLDSFPKKTNNAQKAEKNDQKNTLKKQETKHKADEKKEKKA